MTVHERAIAHSDKAGGHCPYSGEPFIIAALVSLTGYLLWAQHDKRHIECQIRERWDYHLTAEPGARQYSKDGYRQLNDAGLWEWHDLTEERGEL